MKFNSNSVFNSYWFGAASGFILAFIVTTIIIAVNAKEYTVWEHYFYFFDKEEITPLLRAQLRSALLLSVKGGGLAVLPLFYLFLNKKMYKAGKGLIGFALFLVLIAVYGWFLQKNM